MSFSAYRAHWSAVLVIGAFTGVLSGCASPAGDDGEGDSSAEEKPVVLTTFTVLQDMAAEVAGDRVDVRSLTPAGAEIHEYQPTPGNLRDAADADLVMENGLGLEAWFAQFVEQSGAESVTVTEGIDTLPVTRLPGHPDADSAEDLPVNPHAWMSPSHAVNYVENIEQALADLSPDDAEYFEENAQDYIAEITSIRDEARAELETVGSDVHLVSCEGAFSYLAEDLGVGEHYLWPLNSDDEGSPQQVEAQIDYVEEHDVPTIFCESTVNDSAQQQVAEATSAQLGDPLYVDSLSEEDGPVPTYLDMLRYDVDLVVQGADDSAEQESAEQESAHS